MTLAVGSQFSRYRILAALGAGGMGEVYLAEDERLRRKVALKVLPDSLAQDTDRLRRFEREAIAASALNHPNILTIYEFGAAPTKGGETHFLATEFIDGETLRDRLLRASLPLNESLDIAEQIAKALAAAHEARIIHRDIKPENVMLRKDGLVKVLDFGLAKLIEPVIEGTEAATRKLGLTQAGTILGTVAYMSPEQARGIHVDARSDVWSLGVVIYEMLSGRRPFPGETRADVIAAVLSNEPPLISSFGRNIPAELDRIVSKSLAKDIAGRYQTASELRAALEKVRKQISTDHNPAWQPDDEPGKVATEEKKVLSTVKYTIDKANHQSQTSVSRNSIVAIAMLLVLVAAGYFAYRSFRNKAQIDSIAVLPFENASGKNDLTYLSDGLSEALVDRLAQLPQLKVTARNSSFAFRGANLNLPEIARKLGVRALVTGRVEQIGEEMVVRVDVIDTQEDTQLLGVQLRKKAGDLLRIQSEVAQLAAEKLELKLTSAQSKRLADNGTQNTDAWRYYLNGLVELNGPQDVRSRALEYFEQAVSLDPNFAAAYAEIAWIYWSRANGSGDPQLLMPKAKTATDKALSIDAELPKARVMKALMCEYDFDWPGADREYKRAIELSPNLGFARNNYAFYLSVMRRQDEALAELEQVRVRDPINQRLALLQKGIVLTQARKFDEALQSYQEAQAIDPAKEIPSFSLGYAYGGKGLYSEAAGYYKKSVTLLGGEEKYSQPLIYLAATYASIPEKQIEARAILSRIESMSEYRSPALIAVIYAALKDNNKAMELLEQAYIRRDPLLRFIGTGYEYDNLRQDARFNDLLGRAGLSK